VSAAEVGPWHRLGDAAAAGARCARVDCDGRDLWMRSRREPGQDAPAFEVVCDEHALDGEREEVSSGTESGRVEVPASDREE
jgi:hypothetical protein